MTKFEFLTELRARLWAIPEADKQRSVDYYTEMIDERMEEGLSEEEAVAAVGDLDEIVGQILSELPRPPVTVHKEAKQKKQLEPWMIVLLVLGSPVWIPLVASAVSAVFSVYVSLWSVVIALYATFAALAVSAVACIAVCFFMIGSMPRVIAALGAALVCAGLAILIFMLANLAAKGMIALTKLIINGIKGIFSRKEQTV